jgi:4-hydroxy-tetrahydrodipicolinate reductase
MIRLGISGAAGRMGGAIIESAARSPEKFRVSLLLEAKGSGNVGTSIRGLNITDDLKAGLDDIDVLIDFTSPSATLAHLKIMADAKKAVVIGTTGFDSNEIFEIEQAANKIPVSFSSNYSVGINVLWKLLKDAVKALKADYDIDIVEAHHSMKKDAPSGTVLTTAGIILREKGLDPASNMVFGREGKNLERDRDEIGLFAVRAGGIVGEHKVIFGSMGDKLEISHTAFSREPLAMGALKAAEFIHSKSPKIYTMTEIIGLE